MQTPAYRPEIDGLRAIAVLLVVFFHAGSSVVSGGFIGVDVFFVISGFLIGRIILQSLQYQDWSFAYFYERRVRRIIPPLLLVQALCIPFAWWWMPPDPLENFGQSLVAATLSASNILFELTSNYFDAVTDSKPLAHTWSLGVEEQFYLVFPLLAWLGWKLWSARGAWLLIGLSLVLSFAYAVQLALTQDVPSFYLPLQRGWELLIGVAFSANAVAAGAARMPPVLRQITAAVSVLGLLLVACVLDNVVAWPGPVTALPVLLTAVLLVTAPGTATAWMLSRRPLVVVGLASYGFYLFHQPVMAFARIRMLDVPSVGVLLALMLPTFAAAWLSYRYLETPVRSRTRTPWRRLWPVLGASAAALVGVGLWMHFSAGLPQRLSADELRILQEPEGDVLQLKPKDTYTPGHVLVRLRELSAGSGADAPLTVIVGDSHAQALALGARSFFKERGIRASYLSFTPCGGIATYGRRTSKKSRLQRCRQFYERDLPAFLAENGVDHVIVAMRWTARSYPVLPNNIDSCHFDNGEGGVESMACPMSVALREDGSKSHSARDRSMSLRSYVAWLDHLGVPVTVLLPVPEVGWQVPEQMVKRRRYGGGEVSTSYARYLERNRWVRNEFAAMDALERVRFIDPAPVFCDHQIRGRCVAEWDGEPLYFDDDHVNARGALMILDRIYAEMGNADLEHRAD